MKIPLIFIFALIIMFALDMLWLGVIAKSYYAEKIGYLMADKPKWPAAVIFYLMYIGGLLYFAVLPSLEQNNWQTACLKGAILGMLCYATYDLTNMAILKEWPYQIVIIDILWGIFLTSATATFTYWLAQKFL